MRDLTLSIPPGEIFGLLGPNGAGKSTTLKVLATLLKPTAGTARIGGFDVVADANSVRRVIGYVPEGADLYEVLTGEEFLHLVGDLHGIPPVAAFERRQRLANAFEIDGDLARPIGEYSKGMKQKLLLIAALQHEPAILLLDEPLDGLDVTAQEVMKTLLRERAGAGCAVVYSFPHSRGRGARLRSCRDPSSRPARGPRHAGGRRRRRVAGQPVSRNHGGRVRPLTACQREMPTA